ncbi:hypothetical protein BKA80DRAFT_313779 [Phyllosticta citrichinensis]
MSAAVVGLCTWITLKLMLPPRVFIPKKPPITIKHADRILDPGRRDFVIQMVQRAVQDPTLSLYTSATMLSKPLQYDPDLKRTYIVAILQTEDDERYKTCSEFEIHYSNRLVHVTYDVSAAERSGLEALAKRLHQTPLAGTLDASLIRLDLHFLEPNTSTKDCVAHYNHGKVFAFDDPSLRIMPSYICSGYHRWNSYFYKILNPDCDGAKSTSVSFDSESSDGATDGVPFLEEPTSIDAAQEASVYFYGSTDAKDCEVVYELAGAAGLTEW